MTDRQAQETVAQCVAIVVFYHNSERTKRAAGLRAAEVRAVARQVAGMGPAATEARILRPVEAELHARYDPELVPSLNAEFLKAFNGPDAHVQPSQVGSPRLR